MTMTTKPISILDRSGPRIKTAAPSLDAHRGGGVKWTTDGQTEKEQQMAKKNICIGTWNVRSLKDEGKLEVLVNEISTIS